MAVSYNKSMQQASILNTDQISQFEVWRWDKKISSLFPDAISELMLEIDCFYVRRATKFMCIIAAVMPENVC